MAANDAADRVWGGQAPLLRRPDDYDRYKGWWAETGERIAGEEQALARALREGETSTGEIIDIERFDATRGTADGVVIYDADGRIVRWNEGARKLFGYPEDDQHRPMAERMQALEMTDEGGLPTGRAYWPSVTTRART